jgi:L-2-hydroxycarboxylate dehydrogenase (NAD+)
MTSEVRVTFDRLKAFICEAMIKLGLPEADAADVAELMAEADLQGSDGHGVSRLPQYARRIKAGGVNTRPNIHVVREHAGTALLNGDNGMGHLVMKRAAGMAIEKARSTGIGWVSSQFSNHAGPASLYASMPLAHDMIGLYFAVGNANHLPPWGGNSGRRRETHHSGYGDDGSRLWKSENQGTARRDDAGGMDDRSSRQTADRSEAG